MNQLIENIKEQFKELGLKIWSKIQESALYSQATERYDDLSPSGQKIVLALSVLLTILIITSVPMINYMSSQEALNAYNEKRVLIRNLFKTYRESTVATDVPVPPNSMALRGLIESALSRANLLPEQNKGIIEISAEGRLIPQNLVSNVLQIKLSKLNLKQIVDIGSSFVAISSSVKLKDLSVIANGEDSRYFDATYSLYSLNVPEITIAPEPESAPKKKKENDEDSN